MQEFCLTQAFFQPLYFSQTCNLQAEIVYILSAQSRQTNWACRLQVWVKYEDGQNAWSNQISAVWKTYNASILQNFPKQTQDCPTLKNENITSILLLYQG